VRDGGREGSRRRQRAPLRFHVTGDTMTLYVSLNIFHVRVEPQKEARGIPRLIAPRLQDSQVPRDLKGPSKMSLDVADIARTDFPGASEITGKRVSLFPCAQTSLSSFSTMTSWFLRLFENRKVP